MSINAPQTIPAVTARKSMPRGIALRMLLRDKLALAGVVFLLLLLFATAFGPYLLGDRALALNIGMRNSPPMHIDHGWQYVLGADNLGRSLLARLVIGARYTLGIATAAVLCSMLIGSLLGLVAGYRGGLLGDIIMRGTDIIMSFPSLLTAMVVMYVVGGSIYNLVIVLAITRIPIYLRTTRAEVLEVRERMFVSAARSMGASSARIIFWHICPIVLPTIMTIATIDFAAVILAESGLSFLGLGIQPPDFTWGSMVSTGRNYLSTAWWLAFWPGVAIMLTTVSLTLASNWLRLALNPQQRWRLQTRLAGKTSK